MATAATAPTQRDRYGGIILLVALIIAVRVLGISAVLPVFTPYGLSLTEETLLVGVALSAYGLTMAIMQIPMGHLSDRLGRRPVLVGGLMVYAGGNILAWQAEPIAAAAGLEAIHVLIGARLVEGLGAVSSVGTALLSDAVPEERRTFSLAVAGIGAGVSFLLGVSLGPILAPIIGVPGLFLVTGILAGLLALWVLVSPMPQTKAGTSVSAVATPSLRETLLQPNAFRVNLAAATMNLTLVSVMFALPLVTYEAGAAFLDEASYRGTLIAMVLTGGILVMGISRLADKRGAVREFAMAAALLIGFGALGLLGLKLLWAYVLAGIVYFGGHAAQSAAGPSLIGRLVPAERRGAAMGGLNTWTYLGSFLGGPLAAWLFEHDPVILGGVLAFLGLAVVGLLARLPSGRSAARAAAA